MSEWTLRIPAGMMRTLERHLFPGDGDEHGAVIGASLVSTPRGTRLLASQLYLAMDRLDYIRGQHGYRMLTASFVRDCVLACADKGFAYLAVHCHGGADSVYLSPADLASQSRGYPALLDILGGLPAGGVVFAKKAAAGVLWLPDGRRVALASVEVTDRPSRRFYPELPSRAPQVDDRYDRQARLLGDRGQAILAGQKVGVIGAGGAGSLIIEYLARLGVGEIVVVDPDRIEPSNLSRTVGSRLRDTRPWLTWRRLPTWAKRLGARFRSHKVNIARRAAREADPSVRLHAIADDILHTDVAMLLIDCDYLFLAADPMQVRLVFNALVHQYLIPGVQVGAKAQIDKETGEIMDLFSVVRPMIPGDGCLWCNGLISPSKLQGEAATPDERQQQYVNEVEVTAPSVITLNAVAVADAVNDYLMTVIGLLNAGRKLTWSKVYPRDREVAREIPRFDVGCTECSHLNGRLGQGNNKRLPTR